MTHFGTSLAPRTIVLIALLLVRGLLGVGPENLVVCIHGDGHARVESTSDLCCEKPTCLSSRSQVETFNTAREPSDDDDCADYSFATSDSSTVNHPSPVLASTSWALAVFSPEDPVAFLAQAPVLLVSSWLRAPPPPRLEALSTTVLRC